MKFFLAAVLAFVAASTAAGFPAGVENADTDSPAEGEPSAPCAP